MRAFGAWARQSREISSCRQLAPRGENDERAGAWHRIGEALGARGSRGVRAALRIVSRSIARRMVAA